MLGIGDCAVEGLGFVDEDSHAVGKVRAVLESRDSRSASQLAMASRAWDREREVGPSFRGGGLFGSQCPPGHVDSGAGD